jgi:hypothetical protein
MKRTAVGKLGGERVFQPEAETSLYMRWSLSRRQETISTKNLIALGYCVVALYFISFILPSTVVTFLRFGCLGGAAIFLLTCALRRDVKIPIVAPLVIMLLLQFWSIFTQIYASIYLGRPLSFARAETYMLESAVPFFVSCALIQVDKHARQTIPRLFVIPAALSVAFGLLQFCRIPFFLNFAQLYTYKPIDFWDGHPGIRAVGLTFHPSALAMQAAVAFVIIAAPARFRKLTLWETAGILFFSAGVLVTQDRTIYSAFLIFWAVLITWLARSDRRVLWALLVVSLTAIVSLAVLAPRKLGYLSQNQAQTVAQYPALYPQIFIMNQPSFITAPKWLNEPDWKDAGSSAVQSGDQSLDFRGKIWKAQLEPIWPKLAMTGIGPSSGLLNGTGPEDKWVPFGHVMECGYLLVIAMYGLPGLFLFCLCLIQSVVSSLRVAWDKTVPQDRSTAGFIAAAAAIVIILACLTANTVDNYLKVPLAWFMGGLAVKSGLDSLGQRTASRAKELEPQVR